jgi:hypothetical protein
MHSRIRLQNNKGSALLLVLVWILILFTTSLVSFGVYLQWQRATRSVLLATRAQFSAVSGLELTLLKLPHKNWEQPFDTLFTFNADTIRVQTRPFGLVLSIEVTAENPMARHSILAKAGAVLDDADDVALTLADPLAKLYVSGNSALTGVASLYSTSVTPVNHKGIVYSGKIDLTFADAATGFTPPDMEDIEPVIDRIFETGLPGNAFSTVPDIPGVLISQNSITVDSTFRWQKDHLVVSGKNVYLTGTTAVVPGIVAARDTLFLSGFQTPGGQFIAGKAIHCDSTSLGYPALLFAGASTKGQSVSILLAHQTSVDGTIVSISASPPSSLPALSIDRSSILRGLAYTNSTATLEGTVHGGLAAFQLAWYESPTVYFNRLHNAVIDVNKRPAELVVPFFLLPRGRPRVYDVVHKKTRKR